MRLPRALVLGYVGLLASCSTFRPAPPMAGAFKDQPILVDEVIRVTLASGEAVKFRVRSESADSLFGDDHRIARDEVAELEIRGANIGLRVVTFPLALLGAWATGSLLLGVVR